MPQLTSPTVTIARVIQCVGGVASLLRRTNAYLVRWARRKYKRLRTYKKARMCSAQAF